MKGGKRSKEKEERRKGIKGGKERGGRKWNRKVGRGTGYVGKKRRRKRWMKK